jgi:hypothetical protein
VKHPAFVLRVVDENENGLSRSHCRTLAYPVVGKERDGAIATETVAMTVATLMVM